MEGIFKVVEFNIVAGWIEALNVEEMAMEELELRSWMIGSLMEAIHILGQTIKPLHPPRQLSQSEMARIWFHIEGLVSSTRVELPYQSRITFEGLRSS